MENGWLSANLSGGNVDALQLDLNTPNLVLFNDVNTTTGAKSVNGTPYFFGNDKTLKYFHGVSQNTASLGNEVDPYALTLDVFAESIFAPYADMIKLQGTAVAPEIDETK